MSIDTPAQADNTPAKRTLETVASEALVERFDADPDRKYIGCYKSQSLKRIVDQLDSPQQITVATGRRQPSETAYTPLDDAGAAAAYLDARMVEKHEWYLEYDQSDHLRFDWEYVSEQLSENRTVWDIPIRRLVIKLDDDDLYDFWTDYVKTAIEMLPGVTNAGTDWISPPFYAVMESTAPGTESMCTRVKRFHHEEPYYFMSRNSGDETHMGMGWSPRTLDLTAMWSERAFLDKQDVPYTREEDGTKERLTPRKIEDKLINHYDAEDERYGAVNSIQFINKWRRAFGRGATDTKPFAWAESGEWEQLGGDDS